MTDFFRQLTAGQRRLFIAAVVLLTVVIGLAAHNRTRKVGDYDIVRRFGAQFLGAEPLYTDGLCYNYMPVAGMYWAPLALVSPPVGSVLRSLVGVACLFFSLRWLNTMTGGRIARPPQVVFATAATALLLGLHYVVRDLDDGGPHLILLGMLVGGTYCLWQGRQVWAAVWFGMAIALKMTPGLILPFLVWKRRFRAAAYTTVATCLWIASPALFIGPQAWYEAQSLWVRVALRAASGTADENELRIQNQALRPALLRWTTAYPAGHALKVDHPLDVPLLDLSPRAASIATNAGLIAVLAAFAGWTRKAYRNDSDPAQLYEFAALFLLMTLYSPVTWLQHLVWVVPAAWLLAESHRGGGRWSTTARAAVGAYLLLSLGLNRELLGRDNYYMLLSWHIHTICQLLLLGLLAYARRHDERAIDQPMLDASPVETEPATTALPRAA
jgi:alpha-1,2-mannosyltransferase